MPYISRLEGTTMPWIKASPEEELELQEAYGDTEVIIVPTAEGAIEIRLVSEEEAHRLAPPGSEDWLKDG